MQQYDETDLEPTVNTLDGQRQWQLFPPGERRTRRRSLLSGLLVLVLLAGVSAWIVVATGRTSPPTASIKPAPIPTPTPPFIISPTPHSAAYATLAARPLAIPTVASFNDCPTSPGHQISTDLGTAIGTGPLYLVVGYSNGSVPYWPGPWEDHTGWGGIPLALWIFPTSFSGPVLVRGESLDGQGAVLFNQYGGPLLTEAADRRPGEQSSGERCVTPICGGWRMVHPLQRFWLLWFAGGLATGDRDHHLQCDVRRYASPTDILHRSLPEGARLPNNIHVHAADVMGLKSGAVVA